MKILLNCLDCKGGAPGLTYGIALGLKKNGHDVNLILSEYIQNKCEFISKFGEQKIFFVKTHQSKLDYIKLKIKYSMSRIFKNKFKNVFFDLMISTMYHSWNTMIEKSINAKHKMLIIHDPIFHSGTPFWKQLKYSHYYKKSKEVVVLSKKFIDITSEKYKIKKENIYYLPHGTYTCYNKEENSSIKYDSSKPINFLFFGFISKYKGLHVLSSAFAKLLSIHPNSKLTIAGNGDFSEYEDEYKSLNNVLLDIRYIPDEDVNRYFQTENTVLVLPYLDATQSGCIAIARNFGVPVIYSDTGGLVEQMDNGSCGIKFKCADSFDLFKKMSLFCENKSLFLDESNKIEKTKYKYEWDFIMNEFIKKLF